jgi:ATP/maltotriose-dependent transcriptional regulator MalT
LSDSKRVVDASALTFRQLRILGAIFQGLQNGELARALDVSPATAKRDIAQIFSAFGVANRKQLLSSRRALEVLEQNLDLIQRVRSRL